MAMVHADIPFIFVSQESTTKPCPEGHSAETLRAVSTVIFPNQTGWDEGWSSWLPSLQSTWPGPGKEGP